MKKTVLLLAGVDCFRLSLGAQSLQLAHARRSGGGQRSRTARRAAARARRRRHRQGAARGSDDSDRERQDHVGRSCRGRASAGRRPGDGSHGPHRHPRHRRACTTTRSTRRAGAACSSSSRRRACIWPAGSRPSRTTGGTSPYHEINMKKSIERGETPGPAHAPDRALSHRSRRRSDDGADRIAPRKPAAS